MKIGFGWLWWIWLIGVFYDVAVVVLGVFPERPFADRIEADLHIAWFIAIAWLTWRLANRGGATREKLQPQSEENAA